MSHSLTIDGVTRAVGEAIDLGDAPRVRVQRAAGGMVVVSAGPATRDGTPVLGNLAPVAWGEGALVRAGALRLVLDWAPTPRRDRAGAGTSCRLCFARLAPDEAIVACACDAPFHAECHTLCVSCPACGLPGGGTVA